MPDTVRETSVVHTFGDEQSSLFTPKVLAIFVVAVLVGILGGYLLSRQKPSTSAVSSKSGTVVSVAKGTVVGSNDTSTFKDTAEGVLQQGGIQDEGQFHLVRPGGDSQNVYLTSSIVDLSQFVGKKVRINGQTQKAKYAGWLMDVGRVEVLE